MEARRERAPYSGAPIRAPVLGVHHFGSSLAPATKVKIGAPKDSPSRIVPNGMPDTGMKFLCGSPKSSCQSL